MYTFEYLLKIKDVPNEIVGRIEVLAEYKGKQELYARTRPEVLDVLRETTISQSTAASNAIEGIEIPPERLEALMALAGVPRDRPEEEIAGYRDVLRTIDDLRNPSSVEITPAFILRLHKDLYRFTNNPNAGRWKSKDNIIEARNDKGEVIGVVFRPPPAATTPRFMEELCRHLAIAREKRHVPALVIVAAFSLDFLCIHPFDDGNGRIARLLTHLLLFQEGYGVGKFVPLERLMLETKEAYYSALRASSARWHDARHNPASWERYLLDILIRSYRELSARLEAVAKTSAPLQALIRDASLSRTAFAIPELLAAFPSVSRAYVFRVLKELAEEGRISRTGRGRYAVKDYVRASRR